MGTTELWKSPRLVPSLAVKDVPTAVQWLSRVFSFRERSDARLSWEGGCRTWVELGDALINLTTEGGHELRSPQSVAGVSVEFKVYVDDVDKHFQQAKAAGAIILSDPEDGFCGGRIYRAKDLEGHHWVFSQRDRDLDAAEWRLPSGLTRGPRGPSAPHANRHGKAKEQEAARLKALHPVLMSRDVAASVRFYEALGFKEAFRDSPSAPRYAAVRRDGVELHLRWHAASEWVHPGDRPTYRCLVDDVDALFAEVVGRDAQLDRTELRNTAWGTREFHVRDPDRNGLQFYRAI